MTIFDGIKATFFVLMMTAITVAISLPVIGAVVLFLMWMGVK